MLKIHLYSDLQYGNMAMLQRKCMQILSPSTSKNILTPVFVCHGCHITYHTTESRGKSGLRQAENDDGIVNTFTPPVSRSNPGTFFQDSHRLRNQYTGDYLLKSYLKRYLPVEVLEEIQPDLRSLGDKVATTIYDLGLDCEQNQPKLYQYDAWGNRVDNIVTCPSWKKLHDISAEEGLCAIPYEQLYGQWSRLYQAAKLYLFNPSSGLYSCPLAMTDGAAKIIQMLPSKPDYLTNAYKRLTSRDTNLFWTSGQWMTEKGGGSDVANGTETVALPHSDGTYKLYGYKWFTSATDSNMSITLARIVNEDGIPSQESKGLSLFYLETRKDDDTLNNIEIQRLKNKLGTRQLPTAELILDGTVAHRISNPGRGIAGISPMLSITRIHNTIAAVGVMRRIVNMARDYATRRKAFGNILTNYPLHMQTLARIEVETRAAFLLCMEICRLLGLQECGMSTEVDDLLFRLLTPVAKLYTAKQATRVASEGLECFGGQGYIEDTGLPSLFRDSQVLSIWEGTTNILSLDVLRCVAKTNGKVLDALISDFHKKISRQVSDSQLQMSKNALISGMDKFMHFIQTASSQPERFMQTSARDFAYSLARLYMGALLFDHACWDGATLTDEHATLRWCSQDLVPVAINHAHNTYSEDVRQLDNELVMAGYSEHS